MKWSQAPASSQGTPASSQGTPGDQHRAGELQHPFSYLHFLERAAVEGHAPLLGRVPPLHGTVACENLLVDLRALPVLLTQRLI
eukprot:848743-Prorocentrum_minimum.AAC.1